MPRKEGSKNRDFPVHSLEQALIVIHAIIDKGAGQQMDRLLVAQAVGRTPGSSEFRRLLSSSLKYGLTNGTEKADYIAPTDIGLKITKPQNPEEKVAGLVQACLKPDLMAKIYRHFNRNKLPDPKFLKNTLEKSFDVDASLSEELARLLVQNAKFCGIMQEISGSPYIRIDDPIPVSASEDVGSNEEPNADQSVVDLELLRDGRLSQPSSQVEAFAKPVGPKQLFVAHGKNRQPLEDLKHVLGEFGIAFKVAVDEPNAGRPISEKVAAIMRECSAGIFIFTRDEKFLRRDKDGDHTEVWRPSENVVYELGAASILWEQKIIILREDGVNFPSDFNDLGYITFNDGEIANKALDLMKELVALRLVKVQAA